MQKNHLAKYIGAFLSPKNCEQLPEMAAEPKIPPGSALPKHSPGLM